MRRGLLAAATSLLLLADAHAAEATAPLPAKDFARKSKFESAKISPSGDYVAVTTWSGDQLVLGIVAVNSPKITATLRFTDGLHVGDFWWVGPERVVASIERSDGPLDPPWMIGELYGINADGSGKDNLSVYTHRDGFARMVDPMPSDPQHALISVVTTFEHVLYQLDVRNGRVSRVVDLPGRTAALGVATDSHGRPRMAWGVDREARHEVFQRAPDDSGWTRLKMPLGAPSVFSHVAIVDDDSKAAMVTDYGSDRACVQQLLLGSQDLQSLSCDPVFDAVAPVFSPGTARRLVAARYERELPAIDYLLPEDATAKVLKRLQDAFKNQRVVITSWTTDARRLVVVVESDRNPGDFYLYDRVTNKAEYLFSRRDWIDPAQMQAMQPVEAKARDGTPIRGYLTLPRGSATKGLPLVVMPHGGPHDFRTDWVWDSRTQFLANRGYAVLEPNFRGSAGFGESFRRAGFRNWNTVMIDDITDSVRWAVGQGIADPARLCIFGASWGGYAALMSAMREPDLYRCAVGMSGTYDLTVQVEDSDSAHSWIGRNLLERVLGLDRKVLLDQSPVTHVAKLRAPVLIVHGVEDVRTPFSGARALRRQLKKFDKPHEWMEVAGEGHGFYGDEHNEAFLNKLAEFLDKHIGKPPATASGS